MIKKAILIEIILFSFAILIFSFPVKAQAVWSYVQVQIVTTQNPQGQQFSLYAGTTVSVRSGAQVLDTITTTSPVTPPATIISGLVNLTNGYQYTLRIETPVCDGKWYNGHCWYKGDLDQSCTTVCSSKGGTESADCHETPGTDCTLFTQFGISCSCYSYGCPVAYYTSYNECYACSDGDYGYGCDYSYSDYVRLCACKGVSLPFDFDFVAAL